MHRGLRSSFLVTLFSLVISFPLHSQVSFFQTPTYSGKAGGNLFVADFNSDGKPDILVWDGTMNLGNGDGTFTPGTSVSGGASAVADFNGDGKADVLQLGTGTLLVLLGNGDGTFQPAIRTASGAGLTAVAAVDLNGDGKADVVGIYSTFLFVYISNGDGTFKAGVPYNLGMDVTGGVLTLGDFNGDGKTDVAVTLGGLYGINGDEIVLLGNGDGTFQAPKVSLSPYSAFNPSVAAGDFNGDGKLDLAVGTLGECHPNCGAGATYILLGNGDGTFQSPTTSAFPAYGWLLAADLNGDGKLDLVSQSDEFDFQIFLGNGDGTFSNTANYVLSFPTNGAMRAAARRSVGAVLIVNGGIALADFSGSGKEDLALGNAVLLGNGDGTFQGIRIGTIGSGSASGSVATGDFDKNGTLDVAYLDLSGNLYILSNSGTGSLTEIHSYSVTGAGADIATADFNGDGNLDLLITYINGTTWVYFVLLGNGDGSFQTPLSYTGTCYGSSLPVFTIAVDDFNNDHKTDFAMPTCDNSVAVMLGNGDGTFAAPVSYYDNGGTQASFLVAADLNGDGKIDIAAGNTTAVPSMGTAVLFGNGDGTFQPAQFPQSLAKFAAEFTADMNNDGKPDLVSTNQVALGNGDGTFTVLSQLPYSVIGVGDLNGDGKPDLLVVSTSSQQSGVLLGNGDGTFGPLFNIPAQGSFPSGSIPLVPVIADMNGDGRPDVVFQWPGPNTGSLSYPEVAGAGVLLNTTAPGFELSASVLSPSLVTAGGSATSTVISLSNFGFNGAVTLSCSGLPSGASCSFNPTAIANSAGTSTLTIATSSGTAAGTYSVQIQGSATGAASNAVAVSLVVQTEPDFTITPSSGSPTSRTISAGQTANFSLDFTSVGAFSGTVNLSCGVTPTVTPAPTCSLSSSSVQFSGSGTQTVTVKVATTAPVTSGIVFWTGVPPNVRPLLWMVLLGSAAALASTRKRRLVLAAPVALFVALSMSCGGSSSSTTTHTTPGTPAGTYMATITATSGSTSHTMPLQVVVQ